jgi:hypothetical protein
MLTLFKKYTVAELPLVKVPRAHCSHSLDEGSDDNVARILKYLYSNQVRLLFNTIRTSTK